MLLPHFASLLLAQTSQDGISPFIRLGATELTVPAFEANTVVTLEATPAVGIYGLLTFRITFSDLPLTVFSLDLFHSGSRQYTGLLTDDDLANGLDMWDLLRTQYPLTLRLTNNDAVNRHAFAARVHYLFVDTLQQWQAIQRILRRQTGIVIAEQVPPVQVMQTSIEPSYPRRVS